MSGGGLPGGGPRREIAWLARRDPRLRLLAALALALVILGLDHPVSLIAALGFAALLALGAGLGWGDLLRRLLVLESLLLVLLLTLPFTVPGTVVLELGPLSASREGSQLALIVLLRANGTLLGLMGLVAGLEPMVMGHALARLGVPDKLVHLLLQTVRQIHLLHREFARMRQAMRARAFVPRSDRHTWTSYGWLIGMLLVRAMDRSRRVLGAMRCRGYAGRLYLLDQACWGPGDLAAALGLGAILGGLLMLERLP